MLPLKKISAFFLVVLYCACAEDRNRISVQNSSVVIDTVSALPGVNVLPVYKLTAGITAIVIPLNDRLASAQTFFDTIINNLQYTDAEHLVPAGSKFFDTSGIYRLTESKALSAKIREHIAPFYFVYGTKGFARMPAGKTLLALDECKTNIIAILLPPFDTASLGTPVLCADKSLAITYNGDYSSVESEIARQRKAVQSDYDYLPKVHTRVFGNMGAAFFAYSDDFLWERAKPEQKCFFPSRYIFTRCKDGSLKRSWIADLDLFGIPCD